MRGLDFIRGIRSSSYRPGLDGNSLTGSPRQKSLAHAGGNRPMIARDLENPWNHLIADQADVAEETPATVALGQMPVQNI